MSDHSQSWLNSNRERLIVRSRHEAGVAFARRLVSAGTILACVVLLYLQWNA